MRQAVVFAIICAFIFVTAFDGPEVGSSQRNERIARIWNKGRRLDVNDIVTLTGN